MGTKEDILELVFPPGTFEWFELTEGKRSEDDKTTHITLTEKDLPPLTEENKDKKIVAKPSLLPIDSTFNNLFPMLSRRYESGYDVKQSKKKTRKSSKREKRKNDTIPPFT